MCLLSHFVKESERRVELAQNGQGMITVQNMQGIMVSFSYLKKAAYCMLQYQDSVSPMSCHSNEFEFYVCFYYRSSRRMLCAVLTPPNDANADTNFGG